MLNDNELERGVEVHLNSPEKSLSSSSAVLVSKADDNSPERRMESTQDNSLGDNQSDPHSIVSSTSETSSKRCCDVAMSSAPKPPKDPSLFDHMEKSFSVLDTICCQHEICDLPPNAANEEENKGKSEMWPEYQRSLAYDIAELLGCANPPGSYEMEHVWECHHFALFCNKKAPHSLASETHAQKTNRPRRSSPRERSLRVLQLRIERDFLHQSTWTNVSPTSVIPINRSRSFDDQFLHSVDSQNNNLRVRSTGKELKIETERTSGAEVVEDVGYDSDPEVSTELLPATQIIAPAISFSPPMEVYDDGDEDMMLLSVQECFNTTWALTWHPDNDAPHRRPICVSVWLERGTSSLGALLEPNLMWREVYQADLPRHKINLSTRKPYSLRLLSLCRILEAPAQLDRSVYPFARSSCCLLILTGSYTKENEFLFEAPSPSIRNDIIKRWKLCVARFASLAVTEDMDTICEEFFHPNL